MNRTVWVLKNENMRLSVWAPLVAALMLLVAGTAFGHGGKTHADEKFTALEALGKATELYGRLVESGKLDGSWKSDLERVEIAHMNKKDGRAFGISFHRGGTEPKAVHIFFTGDGKYAGSNFTGD